MEYCHSPINTVDSSCSCIVFPLSLKTLGDLYGNSPRKRHGNVDTMEIMRCSW